MELILLNIFQHINNAPKNSIYIFTFSAEQFLKAVGDLLSTQMIIDLIAVNDFMIIAYESTNEEDHSQTLIFICFVDALDNKFVERFLGIVNLTNSKNAADLHEIIMKQLESKNLDSLCNCFSGLDAANAMRGEQKGLQCLVRHTAAHSQYLSCRKTRKRSFEPKTPKCLKECTTRWLTHSESCIRIISIFW